MDHENVALLNMWDHGLVGFLEPIAVWENDPADEVHVLPDSDLVKRLHFGKTRPRLELSKQETDSSVFYVLEDLQLLLQTWRKRTADITRDGEGLNDDGEGTASELSMELGDRTQYMYRRSARLFCMIFVSEESFERLLWSVVRAKKYFYSKLFNSFLATLPEHLVDKLPNEMWEKVWKHTQGQSTAEFIHAGDETTSSDDLSLEKDRITDLFGSAGNLHMFIFETLFKNRCITKPPRKSRWETEPAVKYYAKSVFDGYLATFEKYFSRLQIVEDHGPAISLMDKIKRGYFTVHHEAIPGHVGHPCGRSIIISQTTNDMVAILDLQKRKVVKATVFNVRSQKTVATIDTGTISFLQPYFCYNKRLPSSDLALTSNRLALISRVQPASGNLFSLKYWRFDSNTNLGVVLKEEDVENELHVDEKVLGCRRRFLSEPSITFGASCLRGKDVFVVSLSLPSPLTDIPQTWIFLVDADTGQFIRHDGSRQHILHFDSRVFDLSACKGSRAMLSTSNEILFCSISPNPRVIATYNRDYLFEVDFLTTPYWVPRPESDEAAVHVLFDQAADRNEFLLVNTALRTYRLFTYEETDVDQPKMIAGGVIKTLEFDMRYPRWALVDGVLTMAQRIEVFNFETGLKGELVMLAIDLTTGNVHEIARYIEGLGYPLWKVFARPSFEEKYDVGWTNGTSRRLFLNTDSPFGPFLFLPAPHALILFKGKSLLRVQFHPTSTATDDEDRRLLSLEKRNDNGCFVSSANARNCIVLDF